MSGMVFFLLEGSIHRAISLERMTHGILSYITSSKRNINQLLERSSIENYIPVVLKYNLPNTLGNLEAIEWQISKYINPPLSNSKKSIDNINLFGDVLGEVVASAEKVAQSFGVTLTISNLKVMGFDNIPAVKGNVSEAKLIFKNLIENALKYCKNGVCSISFSYENSSKYISVYVKDDGIGIDKGDEEYIFYEGYRGDSAMACNPTGTGYGLFQCTEWLDNMGGMIELIELKEPTIFKVSFLKKE